MKNHVLCSNRDALDAAAEMAVKRGLRVIKIEEPVTGESRDAARRFVAMASEMLEASADVTPTAQKNSSVGRDSAAEDQPICLLAGGETTVTVKGEGKGGWARELWLDPERHLEQNDAHAFFRELGDLIVTGPTGTNVNDLYGVIVR